MQNEDKIVRFIPFEAIFVFIVWVLFLKKKNWMWITFQLLLFNFIFMPINIGLTDQQRKGAADILGKTLADEYILLVKTKNYHWNVRGHHFNDLHKFFDEQYEQLTAISDDAAERIRSLGELTPATLGEFLKLSRLSEDSASGLDYKKMIENLLNDHETIITNLRADLKICEEKYNDMGTSDFLTGLMETHEKMAWMLRAFLE